MKVDGIIHPKEEKYMDKTYCDFFHNNRHREHLQY